MSMAIAQQMVQAMNESIETMKVPGSFVSHLQQPQSIFYAIVDGNQLGPLSVNEVTRLIREKKIFNETYMWRPGLRSWELAEKIPEVVRLVAMTPPPFPPNFEKS